MKEDMSGIETTQNFIYEKPYGIETGSDSDKKEPGASSTKTNVTFILKLDVRSKREK